MPASTRHQCNTSGFTLMEMVIGIVVFSIVMLIIITLIAPQSRRSVDPIWQVRGTELAQSLLNEISAKSFDHNANQAGGALRCNEAGAAPCTQAGSLGSDGGETRITFNDVDDYHDLNMENTDITNSLGESTGYYQGYSASVKVFYDDNLDGNDDGAGNGGYIGNTKLIKVSVVTPGGDELVFSAYRSNY